MDCSRNNVYQYISFFSFQHKAATFNSAFLHGYFILHEGVSYFFNTNNYDFIFIYFFIFFLLLKMNKLFIYLYIGHDI